MNKAEIRAKCLEITAMMRKKGLMPSQVKERPTNPGKKNTCIVCGKDTPYNRFCDGTCYRNYHFPEEA